MSAAVLDKAKVLKALSRIIDPDLKQDLVSAGFIKQLEIQAGRVSFAIELTTPACPVKEQFKAEAEKLVGRLPGVKQVSVRLSAQTKRFSNAAAALSQVKNLILVASCKGGVGKSTVAALLASEVAQRGFKVGLLDLDLFGPSLPELFRLRPALKAGELRVRMEDKLLVPIPAPAPALATLKLMSFGFLLEDRPAIMRGPMVSNYTMQLLHQVKWEALDYLFIDLPPGTGDTQLTVCQALQLEGAVIVTTPHTLSLLDVERGILMFEKVSVPILGVVENMAYFACENCGTKHAPFDFSSTHGAAPASPLGQTVQRITERFGAPQLGALPLAPKPFFSFAAQSSAEREEKRQLASPIVEALMRSLGKRKMEKRGSSAAPTAQLGNETLTFSFPNQEPATVVLDNLTLRAHCGCALCQDEYTGERKLKTETLPKDLRAVAVSPLGNYAFAIRWSDGHNSGIYPHSLIKKLGRTR